MTDWRPAPAARALLEQATARSPKRSKASDGLKGDPAHAARASRHNPDSRGVVLAVDLTQDVAHGIDAHLLVRDAVARRDPRVDEAISRGRIWTKARAAEGWRRYYGKNRHDLHAHISIDRDHENDTSPWWPVVAKTTARPLSPEDPIVTVYIDDDTDRAWLVCPWRRQYRVIKHDELTAVSAGVPTVRGRGFKRIAGAFAATLATYKEVK